MSSSQVTPLIFFCAVVYGMMTVSSWSCPESDRPFGCSVATTLQGRLVDADDLADRILEAEELCAHGAADHADVGRPIHVVLRKDRRPDRRPIA